PADAHEPARQCQLLSCAVPALPVPHTDRFTMRLQIEITRLRHGRVLCNFRARFRSGVSLMGFPTRGVTPVYDATGSTDEPLLNCAMIGRFHLWYTRCSGPSGNPEIL